MSSDLLRMDWATHEAARHAVEHWHYSHSMPVGKCVKVGAWEGGSFVGVIVFGYGASNNLPKSFGLKQTECVELTRIAMREHITPITRMVSIAIRMLRKQSPGIRLIVSFADPDQGHKGGIYKGGNWISAGSSIASDEYIIKGKRLHGRSVRKLREQSRRDTKLVTVEWARKHLDPNLTKMMGSEKIRFLMPLDDAMRDQVKKLVSAPDE